MSAPSYTARRNPRRAGASGRTVGFGVFHKRPINRVSEPIALHREPRPAPPTESELEARRQVLEMVVGGQALTNILDALCGLVRIQAAGVAASIRLADSGDPATAPGEHWSLPISTPDGRVLGTFRMDLEDHRTPTSEERRLAQFIAGTAALAIQRDAMDSALRASARRDRFLASLAA